ncbi:Uncharacterized protein ALO53_03505 [Pseudomonas amygdali pv. photiniae]|uniref:Uncharacterized protein n=3 Tax=Pseudomonas amygdali TaxID=47877 RepID=A0A0P9TQP1_PSEA0|nr:Uncharacterized protein ALO53_03505 [Pseudomonas amygdali pv. photiniae]
METPEKMSVYQEPRFNISTYATYVTIFIFTATAVAMLTSLLSGPNQLLYWKSDYAIF